MKAIRFHETGAPENLVLEDIPVPDPGPDQARIRIKAIGVNFIDIYHRTGLYKLPLPSTPGMEAAGIVDAVGIDVSGMTIGERVAYAMTLGAYAEYAVVPAWRLVKLPPEIDFDQGAAAMLQGMTAHYLTRSTFQLKSGQTVLLHAAAGGVGLLLIQMAKRIGAQVIGTVSTDEKAELARQAGADFIIRYDQQDFEAEVKKITAGQGVDVIYDSVGLKTFDKGLNCLKRRGLMALFGQASGPVPPLDLNLLNARGSLFVTRPGLAHYSADAEELGWRAGDLFQWIEKGALKLRIDRTLPLSQAGSAHRALEGRQTKGKVLLLP